MDRMNRKWIVSGSREEYVTGVKEFLEVAFRNDVNGKVPCPCTKCVNLFYRGKDEMFDHLVMKSYDTWYCHGESLSTTSQGDTHEVQEPCADNENHGPEDIMEMLSDIFRINNEAPSIELEENEMDSERNVGENSSNEHPDVAKFKNLIQDVDKELYPGCKKFNRLSFLLHLYNIKCRFGWSNKSFDVLLKLLKDAFPEGDTLPNSLTESQKIIEGLGLTYEKIDACPNDCMLFWKEHAQAQECHICHASRWKHDGSVNNEDASSTLRRKKKLIPQKVLRYFPLKPRLQRLYMSSKTATDMTWHHKERKNEDGVLKHPTDSECWKSFDNQFPVFSTEHRNVRLGLATDGFNPFGRLDSPTAPGNDIDVYLQPLVEELYDLWENGIATYDASSDEIFQMRAALSWTINDFPALGNLSGWSVHGKYGCPSCNMNHCASWLKHGGKFCFMEHHRFLDDVTASRPPSGSQVLEQLKDIEFTFGKHSDPASGVPDYTWKKESILFKLPYWKFNLSKDNLKARRDLKHLRIRKKLWPQRRGSGRLFLPPACFHLSKEGKKYFLEVLKKVKFPDGYASNIARCVQKNRNLNGLSHDCHVIMQSLLPVALRGNLDDKVAAVLIELCGIFRVLCGKTLHVRDLDIMGQKVARVLCCLEKIFLPSFFTIMVHLVVHLVYEAKVAGPVHYRWMYPVERYLKTLKSYVRNKARPEGCIAEAYLAEECLIFCSRYLTGAEQRNHSRNNAEDPPENETHGFKIFPSEGKPYGKIQGFKLEEKMWKRLHRYILFNCDDSNLDSLKKDHFAHISRITRRRRPSQLEKERLHNEEFGDWLLAYVNTTEGAIDERVTDVIWSLARGPNVIARRSQAFDVNNGYRFRTEEYEDMTTENSGIMVVAKTQSYASSSDRRPMIGDVVYYGRINDIIELDYYGDFKPVLFGCDWVDVVQGRGIRKDGLSCTLVNFCHLIHTGSRLIDEPFVFPSQVQQVIYVADPREPEWFVPLQIKPRDAYDVEEYDFQDNIGFVGNVQDMLEVQGDTSTEIDELPLFASEGTYVDDDHMDDNEEDGAGPIDE